VVSHYSKTGAFLKNPRSRARFPGENPEGAADRAQEVYFIL